MLKDEKIGPFTVSRELGSGAMGSVYLADFAQQDGTTVPVALKIVNIGLLGNESAMARFEREAAILKQLKHPHIVRLIATGRYRKTPFIAMEYVNGEPLDKVLARRTRIGWETVVDYAKQLCLALQHAHEKGIIHRDLKPSNLMLTLEGVLKLTDFGIAKDTDVTALTGANSTIGTAAYMSPEQCKGDKFISNKSDLYSLGIVLYELITGRKPFHAENTVDMFLKHVNDTPVRPAKLVHDLPVWLDNLIMFLLEKEKDRRPMDAATVGKMLADIEDKVQTQQSAGAVAASARRSSRAIAGQTFDEEDREAARALKGKKKKKKKSGPWYTKTWAKAIPIVFGIGIVAAGIIFAISNAGGTSKRGSGGTAVSAEEKAGQEWEKALNKRFTSKMFLKGDGSEDTDTYEATMNALKSENEGDLKQAAAYWKAVKDKLENQTGEKIPAWRWVADKRIKDIESVDFRHKELESKLANDRLDERPWKHSSLDPQSKGLLAVRYEIFGDVPNARRGWEQIAGNLAGKLDDWVLYLLARRQLAQPVPYKLEETKNFSITNLDKKMAALKEQCKPTDELRENAAARRDARNACRDVIDLYGEEKEKLYKDHVDVAKRLLEDVKKLDGSM